MEMYVTNREKSRDLYQMNHWRTQL